MGNFWIWQGWHLDEWSWLSIRWLGIFHCTALLVPSTATKTFKMLMISKTKLVQIHLILFYCLFLYIFNIWFLIGRSNDIYVCLTFPQKCYFTIFCSKCLTLHVTLESLLPLQSQLNFLWTIPSKGKSNIMFICVIPMFTLCVCVSTRLSQCFHLY